MDLAFWDKQINRANELTSQSPANELLTFYASVLSSQRDIYESLWAATQEANLELLGGTMPTLLKAVEETGSQQLRNEVQRLKASSATEVVSMLLEYLSHPSPTQFFAKALCQPYGRWRWESRASEVAAQVNGPEFCPFCGGRPQVSYLQFDASSEGANRNLICAACLFSWSFRRGVCVNCGEESPSKLAYFQAEENNHVRVETCDSCRSYIKAVDLTKLGTAVPLVDDVANAALDLWAAERGYAKIEINLVGL
jgi:formate dehydrogenase accessory protein FdhE